MEGGHKYIKLGLETERDDEDRNTLPFYCGFKSPDPANTSGFRERKHLPSLQPHGRQSRSPDPPLSTGLSTGSPPPLCHHEKAQTTSPLSVLTVIPKCPKTSTFCPISYHSLATPSRVPYLCPVNSGSSRNCPIASRLLGSPSLCLVPTPPSPLRARPPWGPGCVSQSCRLLTASLGRTAVCSQT